MDGVIVGSDQTLEWLLPWWLKNFRKHNDLPVAFIDLGLSYPMKDWCKKHGSWIPLRVVDFAEEPSLTLKKKWIEESGKQFIESRNAWFKKPLACAKSPFDRTIWIDLDCEVRGSVAPLFEYEFAMTLEDLEQTPYPIYNAGVIPFHKDHPLISKWGTWCYQYNGKFRGDQEVFSYMIHKENIPIVALPNQYNHSRLKEDCSNTIIQHWHGYHGKFVIRSQL